MKKFLLPILLITLFPLFALISPYFKQGVPYTHDGENHLARFANYKIALKEGQLPPRFAPNLNNHYGYPVFNYNYPLANIMSVPFSALGISYEFTFKVLMIAAFIVGSWGIYSWLKALKLGNSKTRAMAITSFLLAPFTVNLVYVRGNIGEAWAMALFPWLLWLTHRYKDDKKVSYLESTLILVPFFLSHNVSVLFGGIIWFIYTILILQKDWDQWKKLIWKGFISLGMSLWFWLPAIAEKNQIVLDNAGLTNQFSKHFVNPLQLITSPLEFGFSFAAPINTMSVAVGLSGFVALILGTILILKKKGKSALRKHGLIAVVFGWVLLVLQTSISSGFWHSLPLVQFIQFPWRLSLYFVILVLPLMVMLLSHHVVFKRVFVFILFFQLLAVLRLQPVDYRHKNTIDYDLFTQSTSTANENMPKGFSYAVAPITEIVGDWSQSPRVFSGKADIKVERWTGSDRRYQLMVKEKSLIFEPTFYFSGWKTEINNQEINYASMKETEGRIGYWLNPGDYEVYSHFTQDTWSRIAGNTTSIITGAIALWFIVHELINFKKKR